MPHARRKLTVVVSIALGIAAPVGVLLAAASARDQQKARHDHYHELGDAFKTVRDQTRAGSPDMAKIKAAAQVISEASIDQGRWFPAGTGPEAGKTRARGNLDEARGLQGCAEGVQRRRTQTARRRECGRSAYGQVDVRRSGQSLQELSRYVPVARGPRSLTPSPRRGHREL